MTARARDNRADDAARKPATAQAPGIRVDNMSHKPADTQPCACARHKATPRTDDMQADLQKRLNRVIGQLNGVKSMIDDNRYCGDVLTQLAAAESALKSVSGIILKNHLETCVVEQIEQGHTEVIDEVLQLMRKFS